MEIKVKITPSQFKKGLACKKNMLVLGQSGYGKTAIVQEYADENNLVLLDFDLAGRLPEEVAGIPYVMKDGKAYRRMLDEELNDFFDKEGEGYVLFFDEINQATPDTLNTLYRIAYPDPAKRKWAGHSIAKCQIVACGNMSDGTDGTVYLTELPTPLLNRFFVFQLTTNSKETRNYLKEKYKNIPQVVKYINAMLEAKVTPRDIDLALDILQYEYDAMFLEAKLGSALTAKLYDIQKNTASLDPAEMIKNARTIYERLNEDGEVLFGAETIRTKEELKAKLEEFLSPEEVTAVMKGDE